MAAAQVRRDLEHKAQMAVAAYWAATVINAGTMGRQKAVQPKDLLPPEDVGVTPVGKVTKAQARRAEVKKWREVLKVIDETPGVLENEAEVKARALDRLAVLKATPPKTR